MDGNDVCDGTVVTDRRAFLAGGVGTLLAGLAGCSTDEEPPQATTTATTTTDAPSTGDPTPDPTIRHPDSVPFDEPFTVELADLPSGRVDVTLTLPDHAGIEWTNRVTYDTDGGHLSLDEATPVDADLDGGAMGLLRGASVDVGTSAYFPDMRAADDLTITVERDGTTLATSTLTRTYGGDGVTATDLDTEEFVGTLYEPSGTEPAPAVLALHGSAANQPHNVARMLAAHGYVAIAMKYFEWQDTDDRIPTGLREVPIEMVDRAAEWVLDHDRTTGDRVGAWGLSRGGELALLTANRFDRIGPVAAVVGSGYVWPGMTDSGGASEPAWTHGGDPVPFVPPLDDDEVWDSSAPYETEPGFTASYEAATETELDAAAIGTEGVDGPVLLVSGGRDGVWNSVAFQRDAAERLREDGVTVDHRRYADAGHLIRIPYRPTTGRYEDEQYVYGGTPEGYAVADADHWPRVLDVFSELGEEK